MNYNKRNTLTTARTIPTRLLSDACKEDAVLAKVGRESIRCNWGGHHVVENGLSMMEAADRLRQVADRLERMHDGGFRMGTATTTAMNSSSTTDTMATILLPPSLPPSLFHVMYADVTATEITTTATHV
jgi:phosphoenolpyruvate-protein kinase (PTS system EI component)